MNGTGYNTIPQPARLNPSNTEGARFLLAAEGTILLTHLGSKKYVVLSPRRDLRGSVAAPHLRGLLSGDWFHRKYLHSERHAFNGLSQGAAFGDDCQSATNYPRGAD